MYPVAAFVTDDPSHLFHVFVHRWYVDLKPVRVLVNAPGKPFPARPSLLYASAWDASRICNGCIAGRRDNSTLNNPNWAAYARFRDMQLLTDVA